MEVMENIIRDQDMVLDCFDGTINTSKSDGEVEEPKFIIMQLAQSVTKHNHLSLRNNHNTDGGHFFKSNTKTYHKDDQTTLSTDVSND